MIEVKKILHLSKMDWEKDKIDDLEHQFIAISGLINKIQFAESSASDSYQQMTNLNINRDDSCVEIEQENDFLFIAPKNKNRTYLVPNIL